MEQLRQDRNGLSKEEEDSEEPPMETTGNRETTRGRAVTREQGQSQGRISQQRPQQGGKWGASEEPERL